MILTSWRQPQIKPLNKITFNKNEGNMRMTHNLTVPTDVSVVATEDEKTTNIDMCSLFEEHRTLLI